MAAKRQKNCKSGLTKTSIKKKRKTLKTNRLEKATKKDEIKKEKKREYRRENGRGRRKK